jgi:hypothetical protein
MGEEFEKISPAGVESTNGFTVRMMNARGGIIYRDGVGEFRVDSEGLMDGSYVLYRPRKESERSRFESILPNVTRAMEFLGHKTQLAQESTWGDVTWTPEDLALARRGFQTDRGDEKNERKPHATTNALARLLHWLRE